MLTSHGFDVFDLGIHVSYEEFITIVVREQPDVLGMSSMLAVTAKELRNVISSLHDNNLQNRVKVTVSGGAVIALYAE